jgi:hypothetical protein
MASWIKTTALLKKQAAEDYLRDLSCPQTITYLHAYLFATVWYSTQIYKPPEDYLRQILTTVARFIWRGDIFASHCRLFTCPRTKEGLGWRTSMWNVERCASTTTIEKERSNDTYMATILQTYAEIHNHKWIYRERRNTSKDTAWIRHIFQGRKIRNRHTRTNEEYTICFNSAMQSNIQHRSCELRDCNLQKTGN